MNIKLIFIRIRNPTLLLMLLYHRVDLSRDEIEIYIVFLWFGDIIISHSTGLVIFFSTSCQVSLLSSSDDNKRRHLVRLHIATMSIRTDSRTYVRE